MQITWDCIFNESEADRNARINETLHHIFFDSKECCPERYLLPYGDNFECLLCGAQAYYPDLVHSTPRFMESLDAMQLIVESGMFAEVKEEFFHWLSLEGKPAYECRILLYQKLGHAWFQERGSTRQEAFYLTALAAMGYTVVKES